MAEWNRVNYDRLESEGRWLGPATTRVPRWLVLYLALSAILLLPWSPML